MRGLFPPSNLRSGNRRGKNINSQGKISRIKKYFYAKNRKITPVFPVLKNFRSFFRVFSSNEGQRKTTEITEYTEGGSKGLRSSSLSPRSQSSGLMRPLWFT
jgi:hypothetical protein